MKQCFCMFCICIFCFVSCSFATADSIMPYEDSIFTDATTTLSAGRIAYFSAGTYDRCASISVTSVVLQKKSFWGTWSDYATLTPPSAVFTNTVAYSASKNYSSDIGTGTYRLKVTYTADGHSIVRYSTEKTY